MKGGYPIALGAILAPSRDGVTPPGFDFGGLWPHVGTIVGAMFALGNLESI